MRAKVVTDAAKEKRLGGWWGYGRQKITVVTMSGEHITRYYHRSSPSSGYWAEYKPWHVRLGDTFMRSRKGFYTVMAVTSVILIAVQVYTFRDVFFGSLGILGSSVALGACIWGLRNLEREKTENFSRRFKQIISDRRNNERRGEHP